MTPTPGPQPRFYDLAGLAEASGVSARTIRYYQAERLLPAPFSDADDGRVKRYGPEHLQRLEVIGQLQSRGLKLAAIADLLSGGAQSQSVMAWLGYREHFSGWTEADPEVISDAQWRERTAALPGDITQALIDVNLLERRGSEVAILSPVLVDASIALVEIGMDPAMVIHTGQVLRRHLASAAEELVKMFVSVFDTDEFDVDLGVLGQVFRRHAADAAGQTFAEELERASGDVFGEPI